MALYVVAGRLSIYQSAVPVAFRARMAMRMKQPQTSICREQMDGVSRKKRKNHNGRQRRMLRHSLPIVRRLVKNAR